MNILDVDYIRAFGFNELSDSPPSFGVPDTSAQNGPCSGCRLVLVQRRVIDVFDEVRLLVTLEVFRMLHCKKEHIMTAGFEEISECKSVGLRATPPIEVRVAYQDFHEGGV